MAHRAKLKSLFSPKSTAGGFAFTRMGFAQSSIKSRFAENPFDGAFFKAAVFRIGFLVAPAAQRIVAPFNVTSRRTLRITSMKPMNRSLIALLSVFICVASAHGQYKKPTPAQGVTGLRNRPVRCSRESPACHIGPSLTYEGSRGNQAEYCKDLCLFRASTCLCTPFNARKLASKQQHTRRL